MPQLQFTALLLQLSVREQWTIPQLDQLLKSKTILAQLERAS